jgi:Spy/CpxP family protein refolding chaperone
MQMRKSLLIGIVIASLWATTGFVQPVWSQEGGHAGRGGMLLRLIYKAGLTDDQKAQLKSIFANHRDTLRGLRIQLHQDREQLIDALLAKADVQQPLQSLTDTQAAIAKERLNIIVEVLNMLTPDQLKKVADLRSQLSMLHQQMRSVLGGSDQP